MKYRTDLAAHVLDLLDFIEEKIEETRTDKASRVRALTEAQGALRCLTVRLGREADVLLGTQLVVIGFFDREPSTWTELPDEELDGFLTKFADDCATARDLVAHPAT
jgi:hypothetical protein